MVSRIRCEYAGRKKPTEISGILALTNIRRGLHVSMHCSMASQVMESFLSFFQFYELSMLLNYQIFFVSFPQKRNGIVFSSGVNYLHSGGNIQSELSS